MARTIVTGAQYFDEIREDFGFYVDKTGFIKEWWEDRAKVTLITRPRRFGKTLTLSMIDYFFSMHHADKSGLFEGLFIWEEEKYRRLQGTYPVIFLSFAGIKKDQYEKTCREIGKLIIREYQRHIYLTKSKFLSQSETDHYLRLLSDGFEEDDIGASLNQLSEYLYRYYDKKVIILLDEYDTPMQEAYMYGYWNQMSIFMSGLFNSTFKTNPYMERGLMTGITRVSRESIFSDLNHLKVVTATSEKYASSFGFTEDEVLAALEEYGLQEEMQRVREWYDGFRFGKCGSIYNPWSIINFLDERKYKDYWANTSSNMPASDLIQKSAADVKIIMEDLLQGRPFCTPIDEEVDFHQLDHNESAIWSLLLASGYLKIIDSAINKRGELEYTLALTNLEVVHTFEKMFAGWFAQKRSEYNHFVEALLSGNIENMNAYMNKIALTTFSYFDTGKKPSDQTEPERFYHGFVLGLLVDLKNRYTIRSNRESGYGRYDVVLHPVEKTDDAIILEFKVHIPLKDKNLEDTVRAALEQIVKKEYAADLEEKKIPLDRIRIYGFAFRGKEVLIDGGCILDFDRI